MRGLALHIYINLNLVQCRKAKSKESLFVSGESFFLLLEMLPSIKNQVQYWPSASQTVLLLPQTDTYTRLICDFFCSDVAGRLVWSCMSTPVCTVGTV